MSRAFGLVLIVLALFVGLTIYTHGTDRLLSRALAQIESPERDGSAAADLTGLAQTADPDAVGGGAARPRTVVGQRVHDRVSADLSQGAARYGAVE